MFGYVTPLKSELKLKELSQYNAYYCGLCKTISRRYGQLPRLILNYDCSFLAMFLSATEKGSCRPERCIYKPLAKKRPVAQPSETLDFAADTNVLLAWNKLYDDWRDEHKLTSLIGFTGLGLAAKKAACNSPGLAAAISRGMKRLASLEKARCSELDEVADAFACMMQDIFKEAPVPKNPAIEKLAYDIGRWIYLIDAWDDRAKDAKSGAYNPFNICCADRERVSFMLHMSLNQAAAAYDLLDIKDNKGVLDNIIYLGCPAKTEALLLEGEHNESL